MSPHKGIIKRSKISIVENNERNMMLKLQVYKILFIFLYYFTYIKIIMSTNLTYTKRNRSISSSQSQYSSNGEVKLRTVLKSRGDHHSRA